MASAYIQLGLRLPLCQSTIYMYAKALPPNRPMEVVTGGEGGQWSE